VAGESARSKARSTRARAERMLANAEKWERGAEGESRTAEVLSGLGPEWIVRHDLSWPGRRYANLDHVAIGPTGIFVIDSKNWSGSITIRDGVLRQNGYRREREVAACGDSALAVAALVPEFASVCHPVLCFVRDEPVQVAVNEVRLCSSPTLLTTIAAGPLVLDATQVRWIEAALQTQLTAKQVKQPTRTRHRTSRRSAPARPKRTWARFVRRLVLGVVAPAIIAVIGYFLVMAVIHNMADSITQPNPAGASDKNSSNTVSRIR